MKAHWGPEELVAAFRDERGPDPATEARLWARLRPDVERTPRAAPADPRSPQRSVWIVAAIVSAAAATIVMVWAEPGRRDAQRSEEAPSLLPHDRDGGSDGFVAEPRAVPRERPPAPPDASTPDDAPDEDAPAADAAPHGADPVVKDGPSKTTRPRASGRRARKSSESPRPVERDSLAAETQLLRRARAALGRGDPKRALVILAEYERVHPSGLLAEEADAVRTIAKCRSRPSEGPDLAKSFSARHRGSLLRAQVQTACVLEGADE